MLYSDRFWRPLNVLIACEESQAVCLAFRKLGHNSFSCDLVDCSGGHPEYHIKSNALSLLHDGVLFKTCDGINHYVYAWDLIIAHPPCTYLCNASAVRMRINGEIDLKRYNLAMAARDFFLKFYNYSCPHIAIENPVPLSIVDLPPYNQIIQPWQFGHSYSKRTCLWLKGLPNLIPTYIITEGIIPYVNGGCKDSHGNYRKFQGLSFRDPVRRSKTFPGVASAMAEQWSYSILYE